VPTSSASEMPIAVYVSKCAALSYLFLPQFGNLGINFVGLGPEEADLPTPPPTSTSPPFTTTTSPQTAAILTYSER